MWPVVVQEAIFLNSWIIWVIFVIDYKISRCIQNMKWGNPNKTKTEWGCGIEFVQATPSKQYISWKPCYWGVGCGSTLRLTTPTLSPLLSNIRAFQRCIFCRMKQTWAKINICKQLLPLTSPIEKRKWFINTFSMYLLNF